jgi:TetR/AcrR family transcriptional regulator, cholesterol catabolism regulator
MIEIIEKVLALYLKYGIKSITMDDVARELGISKKTLYQHFSDKDDLVQKVIAFHFDQQNKEMLQLKKNYSNAIDDLLIVSKFISNYIKAINPSFSYDLQKYYPEIWKNITGKRREHIFKMIRQNLEKGIKEGLYRQDVKSDIIVKYYIFRIEMSNNVDLQCNNKYSFEEVFNTLFIYHIRGISNQKGLDYLENKIKNEQL